MFFKQILFFMCLSKLICCDKSFTIVLDTTESMAEEIDTIKVNLASTLSTAPNTIGEYIIVPFNDPDVGEPIVALNPTSFVAAVNRISVGGGHECPENSLGGIERALQISKPQSNIFLFTDAYPKDVYKLGSIENLCRNTQSQVVIFLTGYCLPSPKSPTVNVQAYRDVANACSGTVFYLNSPELRQVFKYVKEVINVEWTDITFYGTFTNYKQFPFSVDSFTKSILLAVSGDYSSVVINPVNNSSATIENILESRHSQVIRLVEATPGEYTVTIRSHGTTSVVLYKKRQLPLQIGFSTEKPRNIRETSRRPLPGRVNYLLIKVSTNIKLESVAIQFYNEQDKQTLTFDETLNDDTYLTKTMVEPDKSFRIWINGYDKLTYQKVNGSTESMIPQLTVIDTRWVKPTAEILEDTAITVEFGNNATLACKVTGYPKPRVWWENDGGIMLVTPSDVALLEIPSLFISYVYIENVTTNFTVSCKCQNSEGEDSKSIDIYVHRPFTFKVLQTPEDQTIEYDSEGKLFCQVSAYPEAEVKWYHNESLVSLSDHLEVIPEENALLIKRMGLTNVGEYKCEVSNTENVKTYTAYVSITGIEAPEVEVESTNVSLKLGDWAHLECRVTKGKPLPELSWEFKSVNDVDFGPLPESVELDEGKLKISSVQSEHCGVYRCRATNVEGHTSADITVTVQYPPMITNSEPRTLVVREDDDVALRCDVIASPAPTVRWEMSQDDVIIALDDKHHTDEHHTHRFKALWNDSGNYHCIAENDIGRAEITITVNVLVAPYIEAPRSKTVVVRAGDNFSLSCYVIYGNPVPATRWEFTALDSTKSVLQRSNSSTVLHVTSARHSNEGSYMCIADNVVGSDNIKIYVKVQ